MFIPKRKPSLIGILIGITAAVMVLSLVVIYYPSFRTSFWGDDWYNLWIARASSWKEVIGFFNLFRPASDFPFYRPLTTQFFFWLTTAGLTKMNPLPAHIVLFLFFLANGWLVFSLIKELFQDFILAFLAAFFYLFSATHFYRIYALSQFQEVGLAFFYLWSILSYVKYLQKPKYQYLLLSLGWFFLALLSKESALTLVLILALILVYFRQFKKRWRSLTPFVATAMIYLLLRILFFGFTVSGDYRLVFDLKSITNTYNWYALWSFGIPEDLVNYNIINRQTIINPVLLNGFSLTGRLAIWINILLILVCSWVVALIIKQRTKKRQEVNIIGFALLWFGVTLVMLAFYPFHKFIYSLTIPLVGVALLLGLITSEIHKVSKMLSFVFVVIFFTGQQFSLLFAHETHWNQKRIILTKAIIDYIDRNYPVLYSNTTFYITEPPGTFGTSIYPLTRELEHALAQNKAIKLVYGMDKDIKYEYLTPSDKIKAENTHQLITINIMEIIIIAREMGLKI